MDEKVKLKFECIVECSYKYADELGRAIVHDIHNEWDNGVDYLDWVFTGSELVEFDYKERIMELENELNTYKSANKLLKKELEKCSNFRTKLV